MELADGSDMQIQRWDGRQTLAAIDTVADAYDEVYAEPPYNSGPLFRRDRFLDRTRRQSIYPGFSFLAARTGTELVGFAFGFPMEPGRWWAGVTTSPSPDIIDSAKFAVIELVVRRPWRGQGLARHLLDALLDGRPERYATLLADPEAPAHRIYQHWGWQHVTDVQPSNDAPLMHALVLPLRTDAG